MKADKTKKLILECSVGQKRAYMRSARGQKLGRWALEALDDAARKAGHDPRDYEEGKNGADDDRG